MAERTIIVKDDTDIEQVRTAIATLRTHLFTLLKAQEHIPNPYNLTPAPAHSQTGSPVK